MGERRGRVKSRNMYKGPMEIANGVGEEGVWEVGVGRAGESNGGNGDNCN